MSEIAHPRSARAIRRRFLEFFASKAHRIVPSAPLVIKDDPTLLFTNAGMNPFKDLFLGLAEVVDPRVADTQKCLRVSGKHNDLEEVGYDTYHHTLFEMLGNWSFGDYFKKESVEWAWELLVREYGLEPDRLYATVFGGDPTEQLEFDREAEDLWKRFLPEDRILPGSKKDNFWEMGETGPCGPCSEIHCDMRTVEDRAKIPGRDLVNTGHPEVVEIWNLVFMEFNRKADGSLEKLPAQHVDTGMGFERLCMALQGVRSTYDTDVFRPLLARLEELSGMVYGANETSDIAMRVAADHIRAVAFSIADGQVPSNAGAGYVIRRILRRAVRYGSSGLGLKEPFLHKLVPVLAEEMGDAFPELKRSESLMVQVVLEEEKAFLRTLQQGVDRIEQLLKQRPQPHLEGPEAFELYDTFGFPLDLTALILREKGGTVDEAGFGLEMEKQRNRSRSASELKAGDWRVLEEGNTAFVGYDALETESRLLRVRTVQVGKEFRHQLVFDHTPFYAEGGGQVGDRGWLIAPDGHTIPIEDCRRETGLWLHIVRELPPEASHYKLVVDRSLREASSAHHSATHLLHEVLRAQLGHHVEQKGSLVSPSVLRFDFSHFAKLEPEQLRSIEHAVNERIWTNHPLVENRRSSMEEALAQGAMALFGEKYGTEVRTVRFGDSIELCGGTHVRSTGALGLFRIASEGSVAAGIRRIEAVCGAAAYAWVNERLDALEGISERLKHPKDALKALDQLLLEREADRRVLEGHRAKRILELSTELRAKRSEGALRSFVGRYDEDPGAIKDALFGLKDETGTAVVIAGVHAGKPHLSVLISSDLVAGKGLNAAQLVRDWAKHIDGGGGGQAFFATAGGKRMEGLDEALKTAQTWLATLS